MKKQYYGLDVLKFVMALVVVMIHVKPNVHSKLLTEAFSPLLDIAVPMFFTISSALLFRKLNVGGYKDLLNYCKRIGILYLCWLLIDGWFVVARRPYFDMGLWNGSLEFIKDLFLGTTFPGSWYLSASVMGVITVYTLSRVMNKYIVFIITLAIALYVSSVEKLPQIFHLPYDWYATNVRQEVNLSFPPQMIWISLGLLLSPCFLKMEDNKRVLTPLTIVLFLVAYLADVFMQLFIFKIIMVVALFILCTIIQLPKGPIYKRLRNYSILMFFFHFAIAGKIGLFCRICGDTLATNWIYYLIVIMVSIMFSECILRLEQHKYFRFLRYIH